MKFCLKLNSLLIIFVLLIVVISCSSSHEINQVGPKKLNGLTNNFIEKSSATPIKFKLNIQRSDLLKDKTLVSSNTKYKKCVKKSGIIYYASQKPLPGETNISAIPAYATLDLEELQLHKSFAEETLFDIVKIEQIQYITTNHPGTPCFDLIMNHVADNKLHLGPLTLCGKNEKHKNEWIDALTTFKHCKLDPHHEGKTLVEFNTVNELNKKSPLSSLYYNQNNKAIITTKFGNDINSSYMKTLTDITKTIRNAKQQHNKIRRVLSGRLRHQKQTSAEIIKKETAIRHNIDLNIRHSGSQEEKMIQLINKEKELKVLASLKREMLELKKEEIKESKESFEEQIRHEKSKASKQGRVMIKMIMEQQKLSDYSKCHDNRLLNFKDPVYNNYICKEYYGLWGLKECTMKVNFCRMCCDHLVGSNHVKERFTCKRRCNKLLDGEGEVKIVENAMKMDKDEKKSVNKKEIKKTNKKDANNKTNRKDRKDKRRSNRNSRGNRNRERRNRIGDGRRNPRDGRRNRNRDDGRRNRNRDDGRRNPINGERRNPGVDTRREKN